MRSCVSRSRYRSAALCASVVAIVAHRSHALSGSGAVAAFAVGTATFGAGSRYATVLFAFFVTSTLLSRAGRAKKRTLAATHKGGPRDGMQVLANGGVATICALVHAALPADSAARRRTRAAFAGAYAAANADTWATEIGTLARGRPRSIVTAQPLEPGLSGGVTILGTLAEIAGAGWIALIAAAVFDERQGTLTRATAIGGIAGATFDSILGAVLQERRYCASCDRMTETTPHACGAATSPAGGVSWVSNDVVNFAATAAGAALAASLA